MDLNKNILLRSHLNCAFFNPRLISKRKRSVLNWLIKFLAFFDAVKLGLIVLAEWSVGFDPKVYLIEVFLFDEKYQKIIDVGILIVKIGFCVGFSFWTSLDRRVSSWESFSFLLITETKACNRYRQRYRLDKESTNRFIEIFGLLSSLLKNFVVFYFLFLIATISRCLYHSFQTVSLIYFLSFSLPLSMVTLANYLNSVIFTMSNHCLVALLTEFLILRVQAIDSLIINKFIKTNLTSISRPVKLKKRGANMSKVLFLLNDFCNQFKEIASVFDKSFSLCLLGAFYLLFIFP